MAYCGAAGIPHSWFLGGPYLWSDLDRAKALAWQAREAGRCSRCGTVSADWVDDDGRLLADPPFDFYTEECKGCLCREEKVEGIPDEAKGRVSVRAGAPGRVTPAVPATVHDS